MNHMTATVTNRAYVIHGDTNASTVAAAYASSEIRPLVSLPIAVATSEEVPSARMIARTRIVKATAEPKPTTP